MVLSTKELNYVRDHLSFELLQAKKCRAAAQSASAEEQALFDRLGQLHSDNYRRLLGYLQQSSGGMVH